MSRLKLKRMWVGDCAVGDSKGMEFHQRTLCGLERLYGPWTLVQMNPDALKLPSMLLLLLVNGMWRAPQDYQHVCWTRMTVLDG